MFRKLYDFVNIPIIAYTILFLLLGLVCVIGNGCVSFMDDSVGLKEQRTIIDAKMAASSTADAEATKVHVIAEAKAKANATTAAALATAAWNATLDSYSLRVTQTADALVMTERMDAATATASFRSAEATRTETKFQSDAVASNVNQIVFVMMVSMLFIVIMLFLLAYWNFVQRNLAYRASFFQSPTSGTIMIQEHLGQDGVELRPLLLSGGTVMEFPPAPDVYDHITVNSPAGTTVISKKMTDQEKLAYATKVTVEAFLKKVIAITNDSDEIPRFNKVGIGAPTWTRAVRALEPYLNVSKTGPRRGTFIVHPDYPKASVLLRGVQDGKVQLVNAYPKTTEQNTEHTGTQNTENIVLR